MAHAPAVNPSITIDPNPKRVIVRLGGAVIADSTRALVMRAPGTADVQYIPLEDVDMSRLVRTAHTTYCQYKGRASYWSIESGPRRSENAVWSYEAPYEEMAAIKGYLAFYADRVDAIEELPRRA